MIKYQTKEYSFGDTVYLLNDPYQQPYILVGVYLSPSYRVEDPGVPRFRLSFNGDDSTVVYDFEVSKEKNPNPPKMPD